MSPWAGLPRAGLGWGSLPTLSCWGLTWSGSTTRATQIMITTSSWEGQIFGVTSP